jgi:hypothetical protein
MWPFLYADAVDAQMIDHINALIQIRMLTATVYVNVLSLYLHGRIAIV